MLPNSARKGDPAVPIPEVRKADDCANTVLPCRKGAVIRRDEPQLVTRSTIIDITNKYPMKSRNQIENGTDVFRVHPETHANEGENIDPQEKDTTESAIVLMKQDKNKEGISNKYASSQFSVPYKYEGSVDLPRRAVGSRLTGSSCGDDPPKVNRLGPTTSSVIVDHMRDHYPPHCDDVNICGTSHGTPMKKAMYRVGNGSSSRLEHQAEGGTSDSSPDVCFESIPLRVT
eukprot:Tbor_TRINITY_DN5411_c0_g1::TRINITY_DN5411_c0_g1_i1::g.24327::m.24327